MRTLYLHIGPHKTGTTYIQHVLEKNRTCLRKAGLDYPEEFQFWGGHHDLYELLRDGAQSPEFQAGVDAIVDRGLDVLLSSERVCRLPAALIHEGLQAFKSYRLKIIYSYRSPSVRLFSEWKEDVKHGRSLSFGDVCVSEYIKPYKSERLNSILQLNAYADAFGKKNLIILDWASGKRQGTTVEDLLGSLGFDVRVKQDFENVNSSLPIEVVEVLRLLNAIHTNAGNPPSAVVRERFLKQKVAMHPTVNKLLALVAGTAAADIELGSSAIDKYVFDKIFEKYQDQVYNQLSPSETVKVSIPVSTWIWSRADGEFAADLLDETYSLLGFS